MEPNFLHVSCQLSSSLGLPPKGVRASHCNLVPWSTVKAARFEFFPPKVGFSHAAPEP